VLGADDAGAPHIRKRIWIVGQLADADLHGGRDVSGDERPRTEVDELGVGGPLLSDADGAGLQGAHEQSGHERIRGDAAGCYSETLPNAMCNRPQGSGSRWFSCDPAEAREGETDRAFSERIGHIWGAQSPVGRVAHGVAARVDRLKCIGNGQVPAVAALAWRILRR
jgi:DNA (cytosine-5)-methyltransferase 1